MKPALSVILFTVLSGAGLGAVALVALADIASYATPQPLVADPVALTVSAIGLALVVAGLCASTLHLANPRNAWRSLTRWRSSWLSREALAAFLFAPVTLAYLGVMAWAIPGVRALLAVLVAVLAWVMLYCTAMIYASLKPIRQWHTRRVPLGFWLLAQATGALLIVVATAMQSSPGAGWIGVTLAFFAMALVAKLEYWHFVRGTDGGVTLGRAIGVEQGVVPARRADNGRTVAARLLDVGHTKGTFLTREFLYTPSTARRRALRAVAIVAGFGIPSLWLVAGDADWRGGIAAFVACLVGLLAERWLFFAEARHTVRLYHGEART